MCVLLCARGVNHSFEISGKLYRNQKSRTPKPEPEIPLACALLCMSMYFGCVYVCVCGVCVCVCLCVCVCVCVCVCMCVCVRAFLPPQWQTLQENVDHQALSSKQIDTRPQLWVNIHHVTQFVQFFYNASLAAFVNHPSWTFWAPRISSLSGSCKMAHVIFHFFLSLQSWRNSIDWFDKSESQFRMKWEACFCYSHLILNWNSHVLIVFFLQKWL